jgi:hypothetical protein
MIWSSTHHCLFDISAIFDVKRIVHDRLSGIPKIRNQLLAGLLQVY